MPQLNGSNFLKKPLAFGGNTLRLVSYRLWLLNDVGLSGEAGDFCLNNCTDRGEALAWYKWRTDWGCHRPC
jgi:hypothetical protein